MRVRDELRGREGDVRRVVDAADAKGLPWTGETASNPWAAAVRTKCVLHLEPVEPRGRPVRGGPEVAAVRPAGCARAGARSGRRVAARPSRSTGCWCAPTSPSIRIAADDDARRSRHRDVSSAAARASYLISRLTPTPCAPRSSSRAATWRSSGIVGGRSARVRLRIRRASASAGSWQTTTSSSAVRCTSSSSVETPRVEGSDRRPRGCSPARARRHRGGPAGRRSLLGRARRVERGRPRRRTCC